MEFLKKIYTKYFSVNLKDYIGGNVDIPINKILIFIALGLCIACVFINYNQSIISRFLKKLIRLDAFSEAGSKTLKDIGLADHAPTKRLISRNSGAIKRVLGVVGRKILTYEEYIALENQKKEAKKEARRARLTKVDTKAATAPQDAHEDSEEGKADCSGSDSACELDFSTARFYIIPDMRDYAERSIRRDCSPFKTALFCALIVLFFAVLIAAMPMLLRYIGKII